MFIVVVSEETAEEDNCDACARANRVLNGSSLLVAPTEDDATTSYATSSVHPSIRVAAVLGKGGVGVRGVEEVDEAWNRAVVVVVVVVVVASLSE